MVHPSVCLHFEGFLYKLTFKRSNDGGVFLEKEIHMYLQNMRTRIIREKDKSTYSAKELLCLLTGKKDWTDNECRRIYESILRHYIIDDADELESMLAVSGFLDGYRNPRWSAEMRRSKYFSYLEENGRLTTKTGQKAISDTDALRKREDETLLVIAKKLKEDLDSKNISVLIEQSLSNEDLNSSKKAADEPVQEPRVQKTSGSSGKKNTVVNTIHLYQLNVFTQRDPHQEDTSTNNIPPIKEIFVGTEEIILEPGDIKKLPVVVLPIEAQNAPLSYVSNNVNIVTVSSKGLVMAHECALGSSQTTEVIIQAESGATTTKCITVRNTAGVSHPIVVDIDTYTPTYRIEQKVRLAGTTEWKTSVDAKVGDKVEFQVQYKNTSNDAITHRDVTIKDILPKNMQYVKGTTKLFNSNHPNGMNILSDTITDYGINIGHYDKGANAYVRFTAEVVDKSLQCGSNTLVNWIQGSVGKVTLQDYATAVTQKAK